MWNIDLGGVPLGQWNWNPYKMPRNASLLSRFCSKVQQIIPTASSAV